MKRSISDDDEITYVITRTNRNVPLDPNRITQRLKKLIRREPRITHVNPFELMIVVTQSIKSGITTYEIDEYAADTAASLSLTNPHYMKLAGRIVVDNHQKATLRSFVDKMSLAYMRKDAAGVITPLVSKQFLQYVEKHVNKLERLIDYNRDFLFDFFGFRTFQRMYGIKINGVVIERPQDMYMRTAIALHMHTKPETDAGLAAELENIKRTYDLLSFKKYTQASPTYFNAGSNHTQYARCFLMGSGDSLEGIMNTGMDSAAISKWGGGIGIHVNGWRGTGALIRGTNGKSSGIVPFLRIYNNIMRAFNQGGKRMGSAAIYLMPHHPDIMAFLKMKLPGGEETERAHDLFYAMWIPDLFMERVKSDGMWSLFDPDETTDLSNYTGDGYTTKYLELEAAGVFTSQLKARDVWEAIYKANEQKGVPYILFADHINKMSNQKNIGVIKSSNLCVSGDTLILTDTGYTDIKTLTETNAHNVWNGFEFSEAKFAKTGENKSLLLIKFSDGVELKCTSEHKFILSRGRTGSSETTAGELNIGDKLQRHEFPVIDFNGDFKYAYTHGYYCGRRGNYTVLVRCEEKSVDGKFCADHINGDPDMYEMRVMDNNICNCLEKKVVKCIVMYDYELDDPVIERLEYASVNSEGRFGEPSDNKYYKMHEAMAEQFTVPLNASINTRLSWLSGLFDATGSMLSSKIICTDRQSHSKQFLMKVKLLCNTLGTNPELQLLPRIQMLPAYQLKFNRVDSYGLFSQGLSCTKLEYTHPIAYYKKFITVKSIETLPGLHDTYCFNEPILHQGIFNGVLAGNCAEITEFSNDQEHAVCNLASCSLAACVFDSWSPEELEELEADRRPLDHEFPLNPYFDFKVLGGLVCNVAINLDNIIDKNFYPTVKTHRSNMRHRPIGIGLQGMADTYHKMRYAFDSDEADVLNKHILETMYYAALSQSTKTCREFYQERCAECKSTGETTVTEYFEHNYEITSRTYNEVDHIPKHIGAYPSMTWNDGSPLYNGVFHWELYGLDPSELSGMYDWETLRAHIKIYGTRNSLHIALMPTASTSQLLGNNECFEPFTSNIYKRKTLAGEFIVINKYLINDLYRLGLWNKNMKEYILALEGSIQFIEGIPDEIKRLYLTAWEIDPMLLIDRAADRQPFVDQSQSLNLYVEDINIGLFNKMMFHAWRRGLKTGKYYLHTRPASMPQKFTIDPEKQAEMELLLKTERASRASAATCLEPLVDDCILCGS